MPIYQKKKKNELCDLRFWLAMFSLPAHVRRVVHVSLADRGGLDLHEAVFLLPDLFLGAPELRPEREKLVPRVRRGDGLAAAADAARSDCGQRRRGRCGRG